MSQDSKLTPPSLAQHFDAPDDYVGHFGWLCGYSADAAFLNDAAERFTRSTAAQRAYQGRIVLAIFLDPGNPQITLVDAPGVAHLAIKKAEEKPFCLLHAKIALLGFRHVKQRDKWQLRLIVSTGNWTRQTLEESLDLAWRIDADADNIQTVNEKLSLACADIKAANELLQWIADKFDTRLLFSKSTDRPYGETSQAIAETTQWVKSCEAKAKGKPRFFDNREKSLLAQLPDQVMSCSQAVRRNYLAMGSGFYEGESDQKSRPEIPCKIVAALQEKGLLTKRPKVDLFVNPQACQAVATAVKPLNDKGITIRPANQPNCVFGDGRTRTLHAKFLFSANYRENSNNCNSAWVYLGSGNLTGPGFKYQMGKGSGNLEAGVVFAADGLYWMENKDIDALRVVSNLLPVQRDEKVESDQNTLEAGSGMEMREDVFLASPVAFLMWHESADARELRAEETASNDFEVLCQETVCLKTETGFLWPRSVSPPRLVHCRWYADGKQHDAEIPVIDPFGRIAGTQLPQIDIEEVCWQLAAFPLPPEEDDGDDGNDENSAGDGKNGKDDKASSGITGMYPIRQMMELVENIAARQTMLDKPDWALWCHRLEQTLIQAKDSPAVKGFHALGLNPLSPLRQACFRPSFAENRESAEGRLYENTLVRIEKSWDVSRLSPLGIKAGEVV